MTPSRKLFFVLSLAWFVFGWVIIKDSIYNDGLILGIGVLVSSIEFFAIGIFIIFGNKIRDRIFGLGPCPSCKINSISIKDKLKSAYFEESSYAFCPQCNIKFKLHISCFVWGFSIAFLPISMLVAFDSVLLMMITFLIVMPIGLWIYARYIPLVAVDL